MDKKVRVRIAPSPTGEPHIGTAYIALFNYAFAKKEGGDFILRIEDTDQSRSTKSSENSIFESLSWFGLDWSEGPDKGGTFGPYRQSERLNIYKEQITKLLEKDQAYVCFCTSERLNELREEMKAAKKDTGYDGHCRNLSKEDVEKRIENGESHVIRLKVPREEGAVTSFFDLIRKNSIEIKNSIIDDQILIKADGFPTYHFANVVDDHLMEITHVIRGEEWITSTPKHIMLYNAFGWEIPKFAHLSLLRNPDKSKVSKRKNPVSLTWFRAAGYTPPGLLNFLGVMGYSQGNEDERFTIDELVDTFSFDRFSTSAPVFDVQKLNTLNEEYIRKLNDQEYLDYNCNTFKYAADYLKPLIPLVKDRHRIGKGFNFWTEMFFQVKLNYTLDSLVINGIEKTEAEKLLRTIAKFFDKSKNDFNTDSIEKDIAGLREESDIKVKPFMMVLRTALTGSSTSLPIYEAMVMLGKDRCIARLKDAADFIKAR